MCAVEKVSARNARGENQDAEIVEKTWWNLPGRALKGASDGLYNVGKYASDGLYNVGKGASDGLYNVGKYATDSLYTAGKYAWDNMPSWGQKPVEKFDYTDADYTVATSAMHEKFGDYGRNVPLAQRVKLISKRLEWSNEKARAFLKEHSLDAEFTAAQLAQAAQDKVRLARLATLRPNLSRYRVQSLDLNKGSTQP